MSYNTTVELHTVFKLLQVASLKNVKRVYEAVDATVKNAVKFDVPHHVADPHKC